MRFCSVFIGVVVLLIIPFVCNSSWARERSSAAFKTTHVTLYDCGLTQLEKRAVVHGAKRLSIDVTLAHLDDLLASLVVATDDRVRVKGVNFPSVRNLGQAIEAASMAKVFSEGEEEVTMPADLPGYLEALIGVKVAVKLRRGAVQRGVVLACVDDQDPAHLSYIEDKDGNIKRARSPQSLVLVTPAGVMTWISVDQIASVTPASKREAAAVRTFANQLSKSNGFAETTVELETTKGSRGQIAASFIRQIPFWRTVYKVKVNRKQVVLEAWAVVHNDTTEDWENVQMSLISGLPKSYVLSIASPRYRHRDTLMLAEDSDLMPQLGSQSADSLLFDFDGLVVGENYGYGGLGIMLGGGRGGRGSGSGTIGHRVVGTTGDSASSSLLQVGSPAAETQTVAAVEKEISTYRAMNRVSIAARTSSLVPLIRHTIEGGIYTLIEDGDVARTCMRVNNNTGLVLQRGIASFYMDGRFRGQAELERTESSEVGVWCFGRDPDVTGHRMATVTEIAQVLQWKNGQLWSHNLRRTEYDYRVNNKAGQERSIALEVRHVSNGKVVSPKRLLSTETNNRKLYPFEISARSKHRQQVVVEEGVMAQVGSDLQSLARIARTKTLPQAQREIVNKAYDYLQQERQLKEKIELAKERHHAPHRASGDDIGRFNREVPAQPVGELAQRCLALIFRPVDKHCPLQGTPRTPVHRRIRPHPGQHIQGLMQSLGQFELLVCYTKIHRTHLGTML